MLEASPAEKRKPGEGQAKPEQAGPGCSQLGALKGGGQEENGRGPQRLGSKDAAGQQEKSPFAPVWMTNPPSPHCLTQRV